MYCVFTFCVAFRRSRVIQFYEYSYHGCLEISHMTVSRGKSCQNWSPDTQKHSGPATYMRAHKSCKHSHRIEAVGGCVPLFVKKLHFFPLTKMFARSALSICLLAVFGFSAGLSATPCRFPPDLWCSSVEISRACHVEKQCTDWQRPTVNDAPLVNISLYYESYCPGCQGFITDQLYPTWTELSSIMSVSLVPYGNAQVDIQYPTEL